MTETTRANGSDPDHLLKGVTPLFPLGCPRSGTTLLAQVLNAHPSILMTNETAVFLLLNENIQKSRIGVRAGILYGKKHHELWSSHLAEHAKSLIESYYEKIGRVEGKRELVYWGEKHPHHSHCLDFITSLYPNARYIHIVRDPRDAACSIATMLKSPFTTSLQNWKRFADLYEVFVRGLEAQRLFHIRYEDFVADYEGVTRQVLTWLGLDYVEPVDRFLQRYRHVDAHSIQAPRPTYVNFMTHSVGRWRHELTAEEKAFAVELVGDSIDRYGYER